MVQIEDTHPWASFIEEKLKNLPEFKTSIPRLRHYDMTPLTDDPGNTCLYITFLPIERDYQQDSQMPNMGVIAEELMAYEGQGGLESGEVTIQSQNNEYIIIINTNQ